MLVLSAAAVALAALAATPARALALSPKGTWKATTRLVAASEQINPDYEIGDRRVETWRFSTSGTRSTLRTPAGVIKGRRIGKAWAYDGVYDLTAFETTLKMRIHLVLRMSSSRSLRGTTEVGYFDPRYAEGGYLHTPQDEAGRASGLWDPKLGLKLGLDAFSFTGKRLR